MGIEDQLKQNDELLTSLIKGSSNNRQIALLVAIRIKECVAYEFRDVKEIAEDLLQWLIKD